jgi:large subunit ribosomal protein L9
VKLVLFSDVKALGKRGDVVDVADGYARNFLLPRKLAGEADKGALAQLDAQQKAQGRREAQELAEAQDAAARIAAAKISVKAKAGENGKLFGAVTNADIATAIAATVSINVDKHKIDLERQIKSLGSYPIEVKLHKNVVARAVVEVVPS